MNDRTAALLQITPGLITLPTHAILAGLLHRQGLPNTVALMLAILLVEVPVSWAVMVRRVRAEAGRFALRAAFPWLAPVPWWQYLAFGLPRRIRTRRRRTPQR